MATDHSATIISLPQKRPMTQAERAKKYRLRKKAKANGEVLASPLPTLASPRPHEVARGPSRSYHVTSRSSRSLVQIVLAICAFGLAAVGITMNGWFARSLGSSDVAGMLFLAIGVASDCVALVVPACAARLWQARQRATALVGWMVWLATFVFAVTAGIGFASTNIADVTMARASRVTPTVTMAQNALRDAMAARDRECRGGVGKFCREREQEVANRRQALDTATAAVAETADPQTEAAMRIVTWLSAGFLRPQADDFAMLRLVLLALLPQIGGVLLMIGRAR